MFRKLFDWAMLILAAEEARARPVIPTYAPPTPPAYVVERPVEVETRPTTSHVVDWRDVVIGREQVVVDRASPGILEEFVLKATVPYFRVYVSVDGRVIVDGTWDHYAKISQQVEEIDAFTVTAEDGATNYVFKVSDVSFASSLLIKIMPSVPVFFKVVYCKYKVPV